jgi:hypothetical protein
MWVVYVPHSWDKSSIEFKYNEGTWCGGNFLNEREKGSVTWQHNEPDQVWSELEALGEESCLCRELRFEYVRTLDDTPLPGADR